MPDPGRNGGHCRRTLSPGDGAFDAGDAG